jgi:hypothetical protein
MDVMSDDLGGKLYSENNVATLKGYCSVVNTRDIPVIWDAFQHTKEITLHQHNLRVTMAKWAKNTGLNIYKAPFSNKQTDKDIISLQFNLGEAMPINSSVQQGISILTCRPKIAHKVKNIKATEEARRAIAHTIQFNVLRHHQKTLPSPLPDNYFELRLSINIFCLSEIASCASCASIQ